MDDNELVVNPSAPEPQPTVDDRGLIELAQKRKAENARRKSEYRKIMSIVTILVLLIVGVLVGFYIYKSSKKTAPSAYVIKPTPTAQPTKAEPDPTRVTEWNIYKSDRIKVLIKKPIQTKVLESTNPALRVDIVFDKKNPEPVSGSETELGEGYIFRVTPLEVGIRDINSITQIKMDSFKLNCPTTSVFSEAKDELIDTIKARGFEIRNCNGDYLVHYIPRFGIYYEIVQYSKGDFGYRQKYRAILDEMLIAFNFYPEATSPLGPFKTFIDEGNKILFIHPNLDENCCELPKPPTNEAQKIVMLGNKATFKDSDHFDGLGVFLLSTGRGYDQFVEEQKRLLIEDYKVVKGVDPTVSQLDLTVGGKYRAIRLKGYSWRGNDLIYAEIPGGWGNRVLIFSVRNVSGASFEKTLTDILNTVQSY
jgi:hypothetical protein